MAESLATPYELRERVRQKLITQYGHQPPDIEARMLEMLCWAIAHLDDEAIEPEARFGDTVNDTLRMERILAYASETFVEEKRLLDALTTQAMRAVMMAWGAPKIPTVQLLIAEREAKGHVIDAFVSGV